MEKTPFTLKVANLSCQRQQLRVFENISFELSSQQLLLIEGENGAGKSSLLRLLSGLATPLSGNIFWNNQPIQQLQVKYWEHIHFISHTNGLKLGLSVKENIHLLMTLAQIPTHNLLNILKKFNLLKEINTIAHQLSAGQKRKLALIKLFLIPKTLWLLDEPTTALDAETQRIFLNLLDEHLKKGGMSVISTHQPLFLNNATTLRLSSC